MSRIDKQVREYVDRILREMDPNPNAAVTFVAKPMPELLAAAVRFGVTLGAAEERTRRPNDAEFGHDYGNEK